VRLRRTLSGIEDDRDRTQKKNYKILDPHLRPRSKVDIEIGPCWSEVAAGKGNGNGNDE